jgi:hypothetical protein
MSKYSPLAIDSFCNDQWMSLQNIHPDLIKNNTEFQEQVLRDLKRFAHEDQYHYLQHINHTYWQQLAPKRVSPVLHILSSHHAYQDMCKELHPGIDAHRCALVYAFALKHDDYDVFWHPVKPWIGGSPFEAEFVYWGFWGTAELHYHIFLVLKILGWIILAYGALDFYVSPVWPPWRVYTGCFIVNMVLHLPSMAIVQKRHGVDHTAYLNQAGQVVAGQRDYRLLDTNQGPCYYPAGHLWLYYRVYQHFIQTDNAEHYWKLFTYALHSLTNLLVCQIGFSYFRDQPKIPQLLCYIFLANTAVRREESSLFNDQFLAFFSVLSVYFLVYEVYLFEGDAEDEDFPQSSSGRSIHQKY